MTLNQLRIFAVVARRLSITQTSRELHISQPGVTRQVKLLEEWYGAKLYQKNGRGIELTEEGRDFLRNSNSILSQVEKLGDQNNANRTERKVESLTVGGSHGPSALFLPSLLAVFKESHPHVSLSLRTSSSETIERMILNSEVEIALVTNPLRSPCITEEPYRQERILAFVSVDHPLARRLSRTPKMTLEEFARAPLIVRQTKKGMGSVEKILDEIVKQGFDPNIAMRCESPEVVKAAVKKKMGLGILCQDIVGPDIKRGDFKIIRVPELKMESTIFIIYHNERSLSSNARDLLTLLRKWPLKSQKKVSSLLLAL